MLHTLDISDAVTSPTSLKRKRADTDDKTPIGEPFTIQAHPLLPSLRPQPLVPRLLLPRSCLPLAYLDQTSVVEDCLNPSLFSSHIQILENDAAASRSCQPLALIVHSTADNKIYAVDRVDRDIYALCRLGAWVTLKALEQSKTTSSASESPQKLQDREQAKSSEEHWWRSAVIKAGCRIQEKRNVSPRAAKTGRSRLCLQRPTHGRSRRSPSVERTIDSAMAGPTISLATMVDEPTQSPDETLDMIRIQYQEALYAFKTPLAYFAKGPLSRARAAFQNRAISAYDQTTLVQFLRSSVLSLAMMDIKYRETLPGIVQNLPFGTFLDDECASTVAVTGNRARRPKKTKVGKNGLYAGEDISVTRWWLSRDKSSIACDSADARETAVRVMLLEQRARETQLQIILILETLALERLVAISGIEPGVVKDLPEASGESQGKLKKPKKHQDLNTLLELLADRLSIWQSMSMDESNTSNKKSKPSSQHGNSTLTDSAGTDSLRSFCVDVVLPFFGARLPELTALLCQKLGGPQQSPKRPPLAKAATSALLKPGAIMQRQQSRKPRRTLERVLTAERSASQRPPPSLSRSVTDPVLPRLKREESDSSLASIPLNRVAMHKRYSQREVDLHAVSQATEAKQKKNAKVEQELHNAIAALKKPNPRMAVKELVEDAEKRAAGSRSRKSKNPVRNPFAQGVQVMATPSKNRHDKLFGDNPRLPRPHAMATSRPKIDDVPPSSASRISDSVTKARRSYNLVADSSCRITSNVLPTVEQTPTRGPSKVFGRPTSLSTTTLTAAESLILPDASTTQPKPPTADARMSSVHNAPSWPRDIQETPTKSRATHNPERKEDATPERVISGSVAPSAIALLSSSQEHESSIYASLGWDDEIDDLA